MSLGLGEESIFWGQNMFPEDKSRRVDSTHLKNNSQIGSFSQVEVKVKTIFETSTQSLYIESNPSKHKTCSGQGNSIESPSFFLVYTFKMYHFHKKYIFKYFVLQFHVGLLGGHLMHNADATKRLLPDNWPFLKHMSSIRSSRCLTYSWEQYEKTRCFTQNTTSSNNKNSCSA